MLGPALQQSEERSLASRVLLALPCVMQPRALWGHTAGLWPLYCPLVPWGPCWQTCCAAGQHPACAGARTSSSPAAGLAIYIWWSPRDSSLPIFPANFSRSLRQFKDHSIQRHFHFLFFLCSWGTNSHASWKVEYKNVLYYWNRLLLLIIYHRDHASVMGHCDECDERLKMKFSQVCWFKAGEEALVL